MIYQPAEDSFLMSQILKERLPGFLKKNPNLKFLEIGAGSGIHLETAKNLNIKKENIFSSDIDKKAVRHCRTLRFQSEAVQEIAQPRREGRLSEGNRRCPRGFNCIHSDLFDKIPRLKFDIVIFNPPYLPEDTHEPKNSRLATTGGKKGNEIILRFLQSAKNYLAEDGKIFLITSSLAENIDFASLGYNAKEIGCEKLFFERLCIWELEKL